MGSRQIAAAAVAATIGVMTALAPSAGATYVTTTTGGGAVTPAGQAKSEGHLSVANSIAVVQCSAEAEAKFESHGAGVTATAGLSGLTFSSCTNNWHVTTETPGSLIFHWTSGHDGVVTTTGALIKTTRFSLPCNYQTNNTQLGTFTGGSPPTVHVEASIPIAAGSSELCGTGNVRMEGNLEMAGTLYLANPAPTTSLTTTTGGAAATPTIHAVSEGGHVKLDNPIAKIECGSTLEGTVESHGGAIAKGNVAKLEWSGCTNSWHVTTEKAGELSVQWTEGHNGTVSSSGAVVKTTRFLVPCNYETSNTKIGTLKGGSPATLHIEGSIPVGAGSSELCGKGSAKWEGDFVTTAALYVKG